MTENINYYVKREKCNLTEIARFRLGYVRTATTKLKPLVLYYSKIKRIERRIKKYF
jgi:hypothetical protein